MQKGQTVKYKRDVMFKGTEEVESKVVAIRELNGLRVALLENGDEII